MKQVSQAQAAPAKLVIVSRESDAREHRSKHGLMRTLVSNMVVGVTQGFDRKLEINGVGYKAALEGNKLKLVTNQAGWSSQFVDTTGSTSLSIAVDSNTHDHVSYWNSSTLKYATNATADMPGMWASLSGM